MTVDDVLAYERDKIAPTIQNILLNFPVQANTTEEGIVEHGYEYDIDRHNLHVHLQTESGKWWLVVSHPPCCGCNALTYELVVHG